MPVLLSSTASYFAALRIKHFPFIYIFTPIKMKINEKKKKKKKRKEIKEIKRRRITSAKIKFSGCELTFRLQKKKKNDYSKKKKKV